MVDQEISQHRAAEGSDERCHHRVSQGRAPLSQNRKCERFWTLPPPDKCTCRTPSPAASPKTRTQVAVSTSSSLASSASGLEQYGQPSGQRWVSSASRPSG